MLPAGRNRELAVCKQGKGADSVCRTNRDDPNAGQRNFFLFRLRLRTLIGMNSPADIGYPDAGQRNFFLFLFRLRAVRTSKFSASSLWHRTDRCLMPWRYFMLYAVVLAGTFWGFRVLHSGRQCAPNPGYEAEN